MTETVEIREGQRWFIKFPGSWVLTKVIVGTVLEKVVQLTVDDSYKLRRWYEIKDLEWVERYE